MPVLAGQRIFTVAGTSYAWEDLVLAGCLWGDWPALEARARDGLACLARLDELDETTRRARRGGRRDGRRPSSDTRGTSWRPPTWRSWLDRRGLSVDGVARLTSVARSCSSAGPRTSTRSARSTSSTTTRSPRPWCAKPLCGGLSPGVWPSASPPGPPSTPAPPRRRLPPASPSTRRPRRVSRRPCPRTVLERSLARRAAGGASRAAGGALVGLESGVATVRRAGGARPTALRGLIAARRLDWVRLAPRRSS